ncbi:COBW domain-containing protein 1 [Seminavis robusta]|uniref:COBW domain-containing protein 1 n=1 Tax=Seminavis robusta TaxID=568900 RepID=A0A9N8EXX6_9STRA|nr:COBW domain-containing protein 1 [Seminavis robusta]|eukprot:Sro1937_g306420.1 COBW domain-containing protein 1 (570) ;mRNA; r:3217-4926
MPSSAVAADDDDLESHRVNLFLHAENVRLFDIDQKDRQLPVTLVTGFLGSGKTTLLRHILTHKSNLRIAAAVNDFAELNIDENFIRNNATGTASRVVELSNGCVCCHLLDDLQLAVWKLLGGGQQQQNSNSSSENDWTLDAINYLLIETSGISDPLRIIRTLDAKFGKCFRARLDSVVTVVDADQMLSSPSTSTTALAQLKYADVILLNKTDLLPDPDRDCQILQEQIRSINDKAKIHPTRHCKIPLSFIMDVQIPSSSYSSQPSPITHEVSAVPIYVSATGGALRSSASLAISEQPQQSHPSHLQADQFVSTSVTLSDRPLSLQKLQQFITSPAVQTLARIKGVVWIQGGSLEQYRCILHLSGRGRLGFQLEGRWTGPPTTEMAFIGRHDKNNDATTTGHYLESLETDFGNCRILQDNEEESVPTDDNDNVDMMEILQQSPEFVMVANNSSIEQENHHDSSVVHFRLTGSQVYGYTEEEIERDLRIDTDAMNRDLVDAVNASVEQPKAFLTYSLHTTMTSDCGKARERVVLCYGGRGQPANNLQVLMREAKETLAVHFRNVQVCKCGM